MGFRSAQTIIRRGAGVYSGGQWVEGSDTNLTIYASVQPANGEELKALPEGYRTKETLKLYSSDELIPLGDNRRPDILLWRGAQYEISLKGPWQSGVISHFKYYASKITNDAT